MPSSFSSSSDPPKLTCWYLDEEPSKVKQLPTPVDANSSFLPQETGKKSSYLKTDIDKKFAKPGHLVIEYENDENKPFYLGGFQLVSNARHVEVYLTTFDDDSSPDGGKEKYLSTNKGIAVDQEKKWYKVVSVIPGGPKPVKRLHIKLLSVQPEEQDTVAVQMVKVTARIPETVPVPSKEQTKASVVSSSNSHPGIPSASNLQATMMASMMGMSPANSMHSRTSLGGGSVAPSPSTGAPGLTQSDLGSAMATMSLLVRSTEERVEQTVKTSVQDLAQSMQTHMNKLEHHVLQLTSVVVSQKNVMHEQRDLTIKQQSRLLEQEQQIHTLLEQQTELLSLVTNLEQQVGSIKQSQEQAKAEREQAMYQELEDLKRQRSLEMEMQELELTQLELEISEEVEKEEEQRKKQAENPLKAKLEKTMESLSDHNYCQQFMDILQPAIVTDTSQPAISNEMNEKEGEAPMVEENQEEESPRTPLDANQLRGIEKFKRDRLALEQAESAKERNNNDENVDDLLEEVLKPISASSPSAYADDDDETIDSTKGPSTSTERQTKSPDVSVKSLSKSKYDSEEEEEKDDEEEYDETICSMGLPSDPNAPKTIQPAKSINEDEEDEEEEGEDEIRSTSVQLASSSVSAKTIQPAKLIEAESSQSDRYSKSSQIHSIEETASITQVDSSDSSTIERPPSPDNTLATLGRSSHSDEVKKEWHIVDRSLEQDMLIWKEP